MGVNGIYGLSGSGLDIESLVKMGMSSKNKQYDKMESQEIANTWLKEAYNDVYMDMTTYKYGNLSTYKMQSNMNAMQASSSNSSVVTATANGAAAAMNHTVTVDSVASNAYLQTTHKKDEQGEILDVYGVNRANKNAQTSNKLADVMFKSYEVANHQQDGNNFTFKYNITLADGTKLENVNGSDVAISIKLKDTANSDKEYTLSYTYDELLSGMKTGEITSYTGEDSLFSGGKTLNDFASAVAKTGANIQGGYDTANDSFSLYNKTSGKDNIIGITADNKVSATLLNQLNLGVYHVENNKLDDTPIDFKADNTMKTIMETSGITHTALSVSLKDVLGLKATSVKNGENYDITVKQYDKDGKLVGELGTFTVDKYGNSVGGADTTVFSMNLSNTENSVDGAEIKFSLGELFNLSDIGKKTNLGSNVGLDELATKINAASLTANLNITAKYDAALDSFSLSNPNGKANLFANGTGASKTAAETLINSLNLTSSSKLTYLTVTNTNNLPTIFGLKTEIKGDDTVWPTEWDLTVKNSSTEDVIGTQRGKNPDFTQDPGQSTKKNEILFSFDISDGSNSATVNVTFGDIVDYTALDYNGGNNIKVTKAGGGTTTDVYATAATVRNPSNNLSDLVAKINTAASSAGVNIKANYDNGQFSLVNPDGKVIINGVEASSESPLAVYGNLKLNKVTNIENITYKTSSGITRVNEHSDDDDLAGALGLSAVKSGDKLKINSADGTITDKEVNLTDVAFTLKVGDSNYSTTVDIKYEDLFDEDGNSIGDFSTLVASINASIKSFNDDTTNKAAGISINVKASYDGEQFTLTNDGGYATLSGGDTLGSALVSMMGLKENAGTASAKEHSWAGTNASVTIDGKTYDNDTNKLTVAGVTYNFLDTTKNEDGTVKKATISVSQDTDKIVDYVKSFVEEYNKLLDSLNEKLSEKKYSDYKPLSKRQEEEMTEKQIEKWNEKAKSGLLYHNSDIQALVSAMREAIYTKVDAVDSQYNTLSSIGVTTTNTKGHLTLDTDKLKKALADDPDCVYQLFASDQDSSYIAGSTNKNKITESQKRLDYANTGIANRLDSVMTTHMKKISDIAGTSKDTDDQSYLGKLITQMQAKMSSFKTLMTSYENKLYKRYDAMEVALSKLNMQLGYISGSFS